MKRKVIFFFSVFLSKIEHTFASDDNPNEKDFEITHGSSQIQQNNRDYKYSDSAIDTRSELFDQILDETFQYFKAQNDNDIMTNDFEIQQNSQPFSPNLISNEAENKALNMDVTDKDNANIRSDNNLKYPTANEGEFSPNSQQLSFASNVSPLDYTPTDITEFFEKYLPKEPEQSGESTNFRNINVDEFKSLLNTGNDISKSEVEDATLDLEYQKSVHNRLNYSNPSNLLPLFNVTSKKELNQSVVDMEHLKVLAVNDYIKTFEDFKLARYYYMHQQLTSQFSIVKDFMLAKFTARFIGFQIQLLPSNNEVITKYNEMKNILNTTPMTQLEIPEELKPSILNFEIEANKQIYSIMDETSHFINHLQNVLVSLETQTDNDIPMNYKIGNTLKDKNIMTYRHWIQFFNRKRDYLRLDEQNVPSAVVGVEFMKTVGGTALARMALVILREEMLQKVKNPTNHLAFQDENLVAKNYELWREFFNRNKDHLRIEELNVSSEDVGKEFMRTQSTPALATFALVICREEILQQLKDYGKLSNPNKWNYKKWIQFFNRNKAHLRLDKPNVPSKVIAKEFSKRNKKSALARKALANFREELLISQQ